MKATEKIKIFGGGFGLINKAEATALVRAVSQGHVTYIKPELFNRLAYMAAKELQKRVVLHGDNPTKGLGLESK